MGSSHHIALSCEYEQVHVRSFVAVRYDLVELDHIAYLSVYVLGYELHSLIIRVSHISHQAVLLVDVAEVDAAFAHVDEVGAEVVADVSDYGDVVVQILFV